MNLIIGGDLVPTDSNYDLFKNGDLEELIGTEIISLWNSTEYRIFNLETPLVDEENPIDKCGPNLISATSAITGIKELNPSLITLANNHILDQGGKGLEATKNILDSNNISYIGAGDNLNKASQPHIFQKGDMKVGVYTCAEHEFTIATENTPGANPFDPLETLDHIEHLKSKCDYVIVLYHGGKEHYRYPSPYLQKVCRKMAQKGADLVICQHSHCIGCYEEFEGSTIIYGQGNFIFDKSESEYWKTSLLIQVSINDRLNVDYIPIIKSNNCIRLALKESGDDILNEFFQRSEEILQKGFVEQKYRQFAEEANAFYLIKLSNFGKWTSRIDRYLLKGKLLEKKYNKNDLLAIQNFIECESHRELMTKSISIMSKRE